METMSSRPPFASARYKADLNVIDPAAVNVLQPEFVADLPEGATRWVQRTEGYELTMCGGVVTFRGGRHVPGAFPGGLVRNAAAAAARARGIPHLRDYRELLSKGLDFDLGPAEGGGNSVSKEREVDIALGAGDHLGASAMSKMAEALGRQTIQVYSTSADARSKL